jgi:hypothetical protein
LVVHGGPVHHQVGFNDRAVRREGVLQVVFSGVEGKIPYKQFMENFPPQTLQSPSHSSNS